MTWWADVFVARLLSANNWEAFKNNPTLIVELDPVDGMPVACRANSGNDGAEGSTGPQGEPGPTGAQGPKGDTGDTGPQGATGAQGAAGATGAQGIQGIQGIQGSAGSNGTNGNIQLAWPVGAVFISVVATNPATLLGFGTWAAFAAGRMLVGLNGADTDFDTVEETGGAKTHVLTAGEMPAHTHVQDAHTHTQNAHSHTVTSVGSAATGAATNLTGASDTSSTTATAANATAVNQNATAVNQSTGGGGAHNNMPPYITVYMWKRTL